MYMYFYSFSICDFDVQDGQDLEVECGKKIIELDALVSKDGTGITQQLDFTSNASFEEFWKWFSPPT